MDARVGAISAEESRAKEGGVLVKRPQNLKLEEKTGVRFLDWVFALGGELRFKRKQNGRHECAAHEIADW